ncbi:MAG TPA: DUF4403 family protein [Rhizomicrobium sp.]|jgi:hypothetical protein|nr:DUF4403 family protein [Rhizomicrobium sp.]
MRMPVALTRFAPALLAVLSLGLCGFQAPQPNRTPPPAIPRPPLSVVSATLRVPGQDIVNMLNERTRSQLARLDNQQVNCLIQKCQLDLVAVRTGDITGHATGAGMQLELPFALHAHLDVNSKFLGNGGDAAAQGLASATTQLSLTPEWHVVSRTQGDVHLSNAKLRIGPLKMSVAQLWNGTEDKLSTPIFKMIDKRISAAFKLHGQVDRLWHKLHQPIKVGKDPQSWLILSPERLRVTPLTTVDGALVISLAADVRGHVVVGNAPAAPDTLPKLPTPEPLDTPSSRFEVSLPVTLSYGDAARLAMQHLKKKPLHVGKAQVRIDKLQILPSGQDLIVAAQFCVPQAWDFTHLLDSCGQGYLRGTPQFDAKTSAIRISNVHYDIGTENLMLRLMRALAGDELGKALEQNLVFDESKQISKLKTEVANALAKPQGRGIALTGKVESFDEPKVSWTKDGFLALLTARGTLAANLNMKGMQ